jgi:hypothetical protein
LRARTGTPAAVGIQAIGPELQFEQSFTARLETQSRLTAAQQKRQIAARPSVEGIQDQVLEHGRPGS